jgi:predicted Zn-dependent peptidase
MRPLPLLLPAVLLGSLAAGEPQEFRTLNGLRVLLEPRHERPLVRLELRTAWEARELPGGKECAGELMGAILERCGAGGLNRFALERSLGDRGLKLTFKGRRGSLAWTMLADSQDQEEAFQFLAHAVFRPALAEGVSAIQREAKRDALSEAAFRAALGFPMEGVTSCELDLPELLALHGRLVRPERSVLVIQGDLNLAQARQLVSLHLGTWAPAPVAPAVGDNAPVSAPECLRVPGGAALVLAGSAAPEGNARTRAVHVLLGLILERTFQDFAGESVALEAPRLEGDAGPLLFRVLPSVSGNAERHLKERLQRLVAQGFGAPELARAKAQWRAERSALALHPEEQIFVRSRGALLGDPADFLGEIQLEEVNEALRIRLSPKNLRWFVRGVSF